VWVLWRFDGDLEGDSDGDLLRTQFGRLFGRYEVGGLVVGELLG
jgi:hypothetical protein